jgi:hypothetical protein
MSAPPAIAESAELKMLTLPRLRELSPGAFANSLRLFKSCTILALYWREQNNRIFLTNTKFGAEMS